MGGDFYLYKRRGFSKKEKMRTSSRTAPISIKSAFLYTGGVPGTRNEEDWLFGAERLINVLNRNSNGSPLNLKAAAPDSLAGFSGGRCDDAAKNPMIFRRRRLRRSLSAEPVGVNLQKLESRRV